MAARSEPEVIVIGAGLAGLVAALCLQAAGRRTWVLERRAQPGGLCGTHVLDGHEFSIACNDFGASLGPLMRRLGVAVELRELRTRFHFERQGRIRHLDLPPGPGAALRLLGHAPELWSLWQALRRGGPATLGELLIQSGVGPELEDWLASLGYPLGLPPSRLPLELVRGEFSRAQRYGYDRPTVPVGGPGVLAHGMARRLAELGGELRLGCDVLACEREAGAPGRPRFSLRTSQGGLCARAVVTSAGRFDAWPRESRPGLEATTLHLVLGRELRWPRGFHTLTWFPAGVGEWMAALDDGGSPARSGFHVFDCGLDDEGPLALNALCYLPRGVAELEGRERERVTDGLLEGLERLLPGLGSALRYRRLVTPGEFRRLHRLSPAVVRRQPLAGTLKPPSRDPATGLFHVGASVGPAGEHAGQAMRSAELAARELLAELAA